MAAVQLNHNCIHSTIHHMLFCFLFQEATACRPNEDHGFLLEGKAAKSKGENFRWATGYIHISGNDLYGTIYFDICWIF